MLLGYGARNCWCFKDWMEIDLTLNDNVPLDVSMNLPAATAMGFKGANASGKTNGLKVLSFIIYFAADSFMSKPDSPIPFDTHFYSDEPAEFYIEMRSDKAVYTYEFTITNKEILEEKICRKYIKDNSKESLVLHRVKNELKTNTLYKGHSDINLRSNASIISTLHQYSIEEISDLYDTMRYAVMNVTYFGMDDRIITNCESTAQRLAADPDRLARVCSLIKKFDTGIDNIVIRTRKDEQGNTRYYPVFYHRREDKKPYPMLFDFESSGTQKLFCQLYFYLVVLDKGGIMILDEFETNLHPDILPHLIKMFIVADKNRNNAQILFTTQNLEIMDMMGRYRIYLFEKKDGESISYRVDEIGLKSVRNDRPISVPYKKKMLGGVPKID